MSALSVTQFVELVNAALSTLERVTVEGEVEDYKVIQQKWVVFDLKDESSLVKCFMPAWHLRTVIEDGMLVRVTGAPKLRPKGFFSFVLDSVQPAGEGALRRAFELLKQKLTAEGLFATERKRSLPRFPQRIGLITSRDAAAYGDFLKVLKARQGGLEIFFIHTNVQGEDAPDQIIQALATANSYAPPVDAIVLVRGGGSLEDLQAFNDERVVRTVATSRLPIVVGIGHERDVTLAELAADQRASTPSNAAELLVRSREELHQAIYRLQNSLRQHLHTRLADSRQAIHHHLTAVRTSVGVQQQRVHTHIVRLIGLQRRFTDTIGRRRQRVLTWSTSLSHAMHKEVETYHTQLKDLLRLLQSLSPEKVLLRGYSITRTAEGHVVTSVAPLKVGDNLVTQLKDGSVTSTIGGTAHQLDLGL